MAEIIGEPLSLERAKDLRAWLKKPEGQLLRTVAAAKLRLGQEQAIRDAEKAQGDNGYGMASANSFKTAMRYRTFLDILDEIADETKPLQTLKFKP